MARKRTFNQSNLSFLDIMSCGFGAIVLFFMIINHSTKDYNEIVNSDLVSETNLLEKQVEIGKRNLVEARNSIEENRKVIEDMRGLAAQLLDERRKAREELDELSARTLASRESIEDLQSDIQSDEEEAKRLRGEQAMEDLSGGDLREILGTGQRLYVSGLKIDGQNTLFLLDASASMLDETIVNIIRRRNMSDGEKRASRKWQRALGTLEWLLAKMPEESAYQVFAFNQNARPLLAGSERRWLAAKNAEELGSVLEAAERLIPANGTSLHRAFAVAANLEPRPDNIVLITDGLPTMGDREPVSRRVSGDRRMRHFMGAVRVLPPGIPVNTILFPMEGDPRAAAALWRLGENTNGSFLAPAEDWP